VAAQDQPAVAQQHLQFIDLPAHVVPDERFQPVG
jgi:hypothetical protein